VLHRNVGDVGAPDLIGPRDLQASEQIGINSVLGMGIIPDVISHDTFVHSRRVMEAILSGVAVKSAQASQQASTISS